MENWQIFSEPQYKIQLKYPNPTPQGFTVEKIGSQRNDTRRVHFSSKGSSELYFEVVKLLNLEPDEEYQLHKSFLLQNFEKLTITELQRTLVGTYSALTYAFTWPQKERKVILLQNGGATYRILYDPCSELNHQVVATIELLDPD